MSHWFHRNILKATTLVRYDDILFGDYNKAKLASDLKRARDRLLELIPDTSQSIDTVNTALISYLSLMSGFFVDYKISGKKIRYLVLYKWTHSLLGQKPQPQRDAAFDMANMSIDVAIWFMKHASYVASKKNVTMDDAKEIHTSLKRAAGIIKMVQKDLVPIAEQGNTGSDLDEKVLSAYFHQSTAEAQEVTVARAIEMQHNSNLISCLANETSKLFDMATKNLTGLDKNISEQWILYLTIKKYIYLAYAYCYHGKNLLEEDSCGEAIRALKESQSSYQKAAQLCKLYSKVKGPAKPVKPEGHSFFTKVNSSVTHMLEKCERENGFIYHQKVPIDAPELPTRATYGLAHPEEYNLPAPAPIWAASFQTDSPVPMNQTGPPIKELANEGIDPKKEKDLPEVIELGAPSSAPLPQSDNGCVVQ